MYTLTYDSTVLHWYQKYNCKVINFNRNEDTGKDAVVDKNWTITVNVHIRYLYTF